MVSFTDEETIVEKVLGRERLGRDGSKRAGPSKRGVVPNEAKLLFQLIYYANTAAQIV